MLLFEKREGGLLIYARDHGMIHVVHQSMLGSVLSKILVLGRFQLMTLFHGGRCNRGGA